MTERKRLTRSTHNLQLNILEGGDTPYVNKESRDWLFSQRHKWLNRIMRMTIEQYNKKIDKRRPFWIIGFAARGISSFDEIGKSDAYFQHVSGEGRKKWYLEREVIEIDESRKFVVERKMDYRNHCKRLIVIIPEENGECRYRQEERNSIEPWHVTREFVFSPVEGFHTDRDFFYSTNSWCETIKKKAK